MRQILTSYAIVWLALSSLTCCAVEPLDDESATGAQAVEAAAAPTILTLEVLDAEADTPDDKYGFVARSPTGARVTSLAAGGTFVATVPRETTRALGVRGAAFVRVDVAYRDDQFFGFEERAPVQSRALDADGAWESSTLTVTRDRRATRASFKVTMLCASCPGAKNGFVVTRAGGEIPIARR